MQLEQLLITPFLIVFSLGLLITSLMSYQRSKNTKLIFVSVVFFLFLLKGILMGIDVMYPGIPLLSSLFSFAVVDVIILVLLFIATLKR
jgi:hypothetical protein